MSDPTDVPRSSANDGIAQDALVVDRIVDGRHAVLLIGPDEIELVIDVDLLPAGTVEGDWLRLGFVPDPASTASRRADVEARMTRLRDERSGGRFSPSG
jgi:hypothetical protein